MHVCRDGTQIHASFPLFLSLLLGQSQILHRHFRKGGCFYLQRGQVEKATAQGQLRVHNLQSGRRQAAVNMEAQLNVLLPDIFHIMSHILQLLLFLKIH